MDLRTARRALVSYMPELERLWDRLVDGVDGDEDVAKFLSFWCPPRYLVCCSQAVLHDDQGPLLIRNYDLDPRLNEATLLDAAWRRRRVIGMVEGMAGLADGMNDAGVACSVTFGGRTATGRGFGIPLIVRYVLEVCNDLPTAVEALRAVPCHMSYNVTVLDASSDWATVMLSPDRPPIVTRNPAVTNHQIGVEWPLHGRASNTLARAQHLEQVLCRPGLGGAELTAALLSPPLFETGYYRGFGTVYTACYRPWQGEASLHWQRAEPQRWRIGATDGRRLHVEYTERGSTLVGVEAVEAAAGSATGVAGEHQHGIRRKRCRHPDCLDPLPPVLGGA